jgi:Zn-dependent M16 (insulinase) family peptidase
MQQSIPEMKRDGSVVASSVWGELLYSENSTSRVASVLSQSEFIPKLVKQLQESPDQVVADFNEIRKCCEQL